MPQAALVLVHSHPPEAADRASPFRILPRPLNILPATPEQHWLRKIGTLRAVNPHAAGLVEGLIDAYLDDARVAFEREDRAAQL